MQVLEREPEAGLKGPMSVAAMPRAGETVLEGDRRWVVVAVEHEAVGVWKLSEPVTRVLVEEASKKAPRAEEPQPARAESGECMGAARGVLAHWRAWSGECLILDDGTGVLARVWRAAVDSRIRWVVTAEEVGPRGCLEGESATLEGARESAEAALVAGGRVAVLELLKNTPLGEDALERCGVRRSVLAPALEDLRAAGLVDHWPDGGWRGGWLLTETGRGDAGALAALLGDFDRRTCGEVAEELAARLRQSWGVRADNLAGWLERVVAEQRGRKS